jgi:hypothetical protein
MATKAQIRANRRNAQKSTGPRTPQGKAVVSQNAIKHGLFARQDVISSESQADFFIRVSKRFMKFQKIQTQQNLTNTVNHNRQKCK